MKAREKSNYVKIPKTNILIAREESYKGLNWENAHYALADNGMHMPSPYRFMNHFVNVVAAYEGKIKLLDGNNKPLPRSEVEELYKKVTSNCWTWLNAKFIERENILHIETDLRSILREKTETMTVTRSPLEKCVMEDGFVDLEFNKQGLPTLKSKEQVYELGKDLYFCYPRIDSVARFVAVSVRASLDCYWNSQYSDSGCGVFACAEGTPKN